MNIELILKYFPEINEEQQRQFSMLQELYAEWNAKINVISRKDIDNLYEHHVLLWQLPRPFILGMVPRYSIWELGAVSLVFPWQLCFPNVISN